MIATADTVLEQAQAAPLDQTLEAACVIGQTLCRTAFWDDGRQQCNWLGQTTAADAGAPASEACSAALPEHLYSGSAGVALFLIELYGQSPDPVFKHTAVGALRRSIDYLRQFPPHGHTASFFTGAPGLMYVAARLQDYDPTVDLAADIGWLLDQTIAALAAPHPLDMLSGNAGAIPALLALARRPGLARCLELAYQCGEELCSAAQWEGPVCAWVADQASGGRIGALPMTGLSHGAAGMALALLELYAVTDSARFRDTARGAFGYEDGLFSPEQGNWLDTRAPYTLHNGTLTGTFQTAWCHGAAGIALTRLRAQQLDPEQAATHAALVRCAVATTISVSDQHLTTPRYDATLCHGIAGLGEVILTCGEVLNDDSYRTYAAHSAATLIQQYSRHGDWPSSSHSGGTNPALMIGSAGIGYHFLRLHAPQVTPPILLIQPDSAAARDALRSL